MQCPWDSWAPASVRFCEEQLCAWVTQPANTYSNVFFLVAGFFIVRNFPKHWLVTINMRRLGLFDKPASAVFAYALYIGMILFALVLNLTYPASGIALFATYICIALSLEIEVHVRNGFTNYRYLAGAITCFGLSFAFWIADIKGWWCNPSNHMINGHAIWHILNAFTIVLFAYFYAESGVVQTQAQAKKGIS